MEFFLWVTLTNILLSTLFRQVIFMSYHLLRKGKKKDREETHKIIDIKISTPSISVVVVGTVRFFLPIRVASRLSRFHLSFIENCIRYRILVSLAYCIFKIVKAIFWVCINSYNCTPPVFWIVKRDQDFLSDHLLLAFNFQCILTLKWLHFLLTKYFHLLNYIFLFISHPSILCLIYQSVL